MTLSMAASFYEKSVSHEASSLCEAASLCVTASLMFDGLTLNVQNSFLMCSFCEAASLLEVPSIRLSEAVKIYKTTA